jgi:hypothetical protein
MTTWTQADMIKSLVTLTTISALQIYSTGPTTAGQFTTDSDLSGFTLTMSRAQIKETIANRYLTAPLVMLPLTLVMPGYLKNIEGGLVLEAHSGPSNNPRSGTDRIKILFNPNDGSDDVFAIFRYVNFDTSMTMAALQDSLVEKYGQPSVTSNSFLKDTTTHIWTVKGANYDSKKCAKERFLGFDAYLYERVELVGPLANAKDDTERVFVSVINKNGSAYPANCGTILSVFIQTKLGSNNQYAFEMKETLIDLSKAVAEIGKLRTEAFSAINQIANTKLQKDRQNKPSL